MFTPPLRLRLKPSPVVYPKFTQPIIIKELQLFLSFYHISDYLSRVFLKKPDGTKIGQQKYGLYVQEADANSPLGVPSYYAEYAGKCLFCAFKPRSVS